MNNAFTAMCAFGLGVLLTLVTEDYRAATMKADADEYVARLRASCQGPAGWITTVTIDSRSGYPYCLKLPPPGNRYPQPVIVEALAHVERP